MELKLNLIPNFIKARSPQGLRGLCLKKNLESKKFNEYRDFQEITDKTGKWYICWYFEEVDEEELLNGNIKAKFKA